MGEDQQQSSKETKAALTRAVTRAQNADQALADARAEKQKSDRGVREALAAHQQAVEAETRDALGWASPARTAGRERASTPAQAPTPAQAREGDEGPAMLTHGERTIEHAVGNGHQVMA